MTQANPLHVIILAAGEGTRMRSNIPKVLHSLGGKPLLGHVVALAKKLDPAGIHIVYGDHLERLQAALPDHGLTWVHQAKRQGTGDAASVGLTHVPETARVLLLYGDVPLISQETLSYLLHLGETSGKPTLLTAQVAMPFGFGRILRDVDGKVLGIVEEKDASPAQKKIREIHSGIFTAEAKWLKQALSRITPNNAQKEYYLTDVIKEAAQTLGVETIHPATAHEIFGINDRVQLAEAEAYYQLRQARALMQAGLGLIDPRSFSLRGSVSHGMDNSVDAYVILEGKISLGDACEIGPHVWMRNTRLGNRVRVLPYSVLDGADIADDAVVGPFARLRPGTVLKDHAKVGNFVEVKNTVLGPYSKANHLTYLGDAEVGSRVNIGAGTITCNYDGVKKHKTRIGDGAFIGSGTELVAPVSVGEEAVIGAGSTITSDAPAHQLTLARTKQLTITRWRRRFDDKG